MVQTEVCAQCGHALKERGLLGSAILLVDNTLSHLDVDSLQSDDGKIFCVYLPPNTSSLIQPMDQGILENIKRRYKRDLLFRLLIMKLIPSILLSS